MYFLTSGHKVCRGHATKAVWTWKRSKDCRWVEVGRTRVHVGLHVILEKVRELRA